MRPKERINPFLEKMDLRKVLKIYFPNQSEDTIESMSQEIYPALGRIQKYWLENPDERFSQVLVNLGFIPNLPGSWYFTEEHELLDKQEN